MNKFNLPEMSGKLLDRILLLFSQYPKKIACEKLFPGVPYVEICKFYMDKGIDLRKFSASRSLKEYPPLTGQLVNSILSAVHELGKVNGIKKVFKGLNYSSVVDYYKVRYGWDFSRLPENKFIKYPEMTGDLYEKLKKSFVEDGGRGAGMKKRIPSAASYAAIEFYKEQLGVDLTKLPASSGNRSEREREIEAYIKDKGFDCFLASRGSVIPHELDVYVPSLKIAFEVNGYNWHHSTISLC